MPKILKYIIGYIAFSITLAFIIFYSAFPENDPHNMLYSSAGNHNNDYNDGFIVFAIVFCLIFASSYYIAKKFTQKGYSRLKVRFIFSILVSLASGVGIKIDSMLSGTSMNFMDMFLIILLLGVVVFIGSYGKYGKYGKDLLDFNREKEKIDWKKTWKDIVSISSIVLFPLLSISIVIIIIFLLL